jgi:hypothetical protein
MTTDKIDVTDRATTAGWTLPEGWRVLAWLAPDDTVSDPRDNGDVYSTDVDEKDYDNPTRAFCKHCEGWIRKLDADAVTGMGPDADGREPQPGDWAESVTGIDCPAVDDRRHEPDEPAVVRAWRADRWQFVGVLVDVVDPDGRVWGRDSLWAVESGEFPQVDPDTGTVTYTTLDPLSDDHPLVDLIPQALSEARDALAKHAARAPMITGPQ